MTLTPQGRYFGQKPYFRCPKKMAFHDETPGVCDRLHFFRPDRAKRTTGHEGNLKATVNGPADKSGPQNRREQKKNSRGQFEFRIPGFQDSGLQDSGFQDSGFQDSGFGIRDPGLI